MAVSLITKVTKWKALPGWHVYLSIPPALNGIYERTQARSKPRATLIWAEVPAVNAYHDCPDPHCYSGDCEHNPYFTPDALLEEARLKQIVTGWQRFTREDYRLWEMELLLMGERNHFISTYKDWYRLLPSSNTPPVRSRMTRGARHEARTAATTSRRTPANR